MTAGAVRAQEDEESPWQPVATPATGGGVVISPKLRVASGRLHMFWGWTNAAAKIVEPEFTYASLSGDTWSNPRPPYFGDNMGRVRRIATAVSRQSVGIIFQRQLDQADNAFEVLFALSMDGGWSFSERPGVADSYNHEGTTGTAVAMAGVGGRNPGFAMGWLTEHRSVRVGILNPKAASDRPRAHNVGTHSVDGERLEMSGENGNGYLAVWNEGSSVKSVRLKPLVGDPEQVHTVLSGQVGLNFALTDRSGKDPLLVVETKSNPRGGGSRRQVYAWDDGKWSPVQVSPPEGGELPAPRRLEAVQDEDGVLHVVTYPGSGKAILYQNNKGGRWSKPEEALALDANLGVTGFDVAVRDGQAYVMAAQGPRLQIAKREVR